MGGLGRTLPSHPTTPCSPSTGRTWLAPRGIASELCTLLHPHPFSACGIAPNLFFTFNNSMLHACHRASAQCPFRCRRHPPPPLPAPFPPAQANREFEQRHHRHAGKHSHNTQIYITAVFMWNCCHAVMYFTRRLVTWGGGGSLGDLKLEWLSRKPHDSRVKAE